jgi:hypothetical protein
LTKESEKIVVFHNIRNPGRWLFCNIPREAGPRLIVTMISSPLALNDSHA